MWTATVGPSYATANGVMTEIRFTSDQGHAAITEKFANDGTGASLKRAVHRWLAFRDSTTLALKCVAPGTSVSFDPDAPPATPQPTADDILASQFAAKWRDVVLLERAVARAMGTAQQNSAVSNQLATAQGELQALYRQKPAVCIPLMVTF